jgi:hypothetical protein
MEDLEGEVALSKKGQGKRSESSRSPFLLRPGILKMNRPELCNFPVYNRARIFNPYGLKEQVTEKKWQPSHFK